MVHGSPNVLIGNHGGKLEPLPPPRYDQAFVLRVEPDGRPLANCRYRIVRGDGSIVLGITNDLGETSLLASDHAERLTVQLLEDD